MFKKGNQHTDMQIRHAMNANEACHWMLAGYADPDASYPDADPDAT